VSFAQLAEFVWFAETGAVFPVGAPSGRDRGAALASSQSRPKGAPTPLLGVHRGRAAREGITFKQTPYALED
jgi:hypothetical protein